MVFRDTPRCAAIAGLVMIPRCDSTHNTIASLSLQCTLRSPDCRPLYFRMGLALP